MSIPDSPADPAAKSPNKPTSPDVYATDPGVNPRAELGCPIAGEITRKIIAVINKAIFIIFISI
jgi:hypothetical protein